MKIKTHLLAAILLLITGTSFLQAQPVQKGNFEVDAYYGFPNLSTAALKLIVDEVVDSPDLTAKGLGPFGIRAHYVVAERLGVGLDFWYARSTISYTTTELDSTLGIPVDTFTVRMDNIRPRIIARVDYHLGNSDVVDPYVAAGIGANLAHFKFTTEDPYFDKNSFSIPGIFPIAYRLAFGTRFYFAKYVGLGAEIGIGGPLVTVGLTGRF